MTDPATPSRTMTAGTAARLDRIGTDGRYVTVPMDHGLTLGATTGLVDGVGPAAGDGVDGGLDIDESSGRPEGEPVVHRDGDIPAVRPDAVEASGDACVHRT